jgi:hypothetical protein
MDNYVEAAKHQREVNGAWKTYGEIYQERMQKSHENMENQIHNAWEKNGKKSVEFLDSALEDAKEIK